MTKLLMTAMILLSPSPLPEIELEATYYGTSDEGKVDHFHNKPTASGEIFERDNPYTAAHPSWGDMENPDEEFWVELLNPQNGRTLTVRINDRMKEGTPDNKIDVSEAGAIELGFKKAGRTPLIARILYKR